MEMLAQSPYKQTKEVREVDVSTFTHVLVRVSKVSWPLKSALATTYDECLDFFHSSSVLK